MDNLQNARLTVYSREQMAKMVVKRGYTKQSAAAAFHVSAKTAAKWACRYREQGLAGLKDLSSRPHRSPRRTLSFLLERAFSLHRLRYADGLPMATEESTLLLDRFPEIDTIDCPVATKREC